MAETKNVIVNMFDSWQFNYTGAYGNDWIKTPNFDRFAREGALFENAYAEGLPTVPVRRALQTGRATLHETGWSPLRQQDTTIADRCWGQGIDTALIFDCPMYRLPKYGYSRGYDKVYFLHGHEADHQYYAKNPLIHKNPLDYITKNQLENGDKVAGGSVVKPLLEEIEDYLKHRQYWKVEADQNVPRVMKKAVAYLEDIDRNQSFFLWVDSFDPHEPWDPPSVYDPELPCPYDPTYTGPELFLPFQERVDGMFTERELQHIRALYAEKVTMCDRAFGYFMDNVRRLGLEESTLFVLISDHGEPLGNGEHGHGIMRKCRPWPYEELVHIPLMIKGPGIPAGQRIKSFVQNYDITPTITNWLGLSGAENMHGKDLMPLMQGKVSKVRDFAVTGYYGASWSIITEEWSFIHWLASDTLVKSGAGILLWSNDGNNDMDSGGDGPSVALSMSNEALNEFIEYSKTMTLDGAAQWTCTPGAKVEVPAHDELYDRKKDPFQLNNIIGKHPDVAAKLLQTLKVFMADTAAS